MAAEPVSELDGRFSDPSAVATPWSVADRALRRAPVFWLTTTRADGRPHVTPVLALWRRRRLAFCTGAAEQKAVNLRHDPRCVLTTGTAALDVGLDLVVEGAAVPVTDEAELTALAAGWERKYGPDWAFVVDNGAFLGRGGRADVFAVAPSTVFGFAKGLYSQTRWRFSTEPHAGE